MDVLFRQRRRAPAGRAVAEGVGVVPVSLLVLVLAFVLVLVFVLVFVLLLLLLVLVVVVVMVVAVLGAVLGRGGGALLGEGGEGRGGHGQHGLLRRRRLFACGRTGEGVRSKQSEWVVFPWQRAWTHLGWRASPAG